MSASSVSAGPALTSTCCRLSYAHSNPCSVPFDLVTEFMISL
jgi:hypothetical protein